MKNSRRTIALAIAIVCILSFGSLLSKVGTARAEVYAYVGDRWTLGHLVMTTHGILLFLDCDGQLWRAPYGIQITQDSCGSGGQGTTQWVPQLPNSPDPQLPPDPRPKPCPHCVQIPEFEEFMQDRFRDSWDKLRPQFREYLR